MPRNNASTDSTDQDHHTWTPFEPCPYCDCEDIRVLVITENIVRGDGGGGITHQEWVREYDLLTAECSNCETDLYEAPDTAHDL